VDWPAVSIVIPCRNEIRHIGACLDSILASEYPRERLEVVIADGMSDDGTRDALAHYTAAYGWIRVLDNPKRITPCGMNLAIRAAGGEIIIRMDAHAIYPPDYVTRLVRARQETGADNVGTPVNTLPADDTPMARAIAVGLSHRLGVGNSHFRVGTSTRKWVDHVPFGCWGRELFDRVGLFDEELPRDQDVEFNARLLNRGGRILLLPDIASGYHARRTIRQVGRMLYQYGYFKPLVARKAGRIMTVRQVVPSLFVLGLAGSAILIPWWPIALRVFAGIAGVYGILVAGAALQTARRHDWRAGLALVAVLPIMHVNYGIGYLLGLGDHFLPFRRARGASAAIALSR
jgi:glycosyltransferase involved in cell wall biosynthesis